MSLRQPENQDPGGTAASNGQHRHRYWFLVGFDQVIKEQNQISWTLAVGKEQQDGKLIGDLLQK